MMQLNRCVIFACCIIGFFSCATSTSRVSSDMSDKMSADQEVFLKATQSYINGNYKESEEKVIQLLRNNDAKTDYLNLLSHVYLRMDNCEEAIKTSKKSLISAIHQVEPYYIISFCQLMKNDVQLATLTIDRGLARFPDNAYLLLNQGTVALRQNQLQLANQVYNKILKSKKEWFPALQGLAFVYMHQEDYKAALELWTKISYEESNRVEVAINMGICLRELKQFKDAEAKFLEVLKTSPNHPFALFNLGLLNNDHLDNSTAALGFFEQYKQVLGKALLESDSVHRHIAEAKDKIKVQ